MMSTDYDGLVRIVLNATVDCSNNQVRFSNLHETDTYLRQMGFKLGWKAPYGPRDGWMLFYWSAFGAGGKGIVVRIKTHGESQGRPRAFRPHMSVAWMEHGIDYNPNEISKYNVRGVAESKAPPAGASDAQKNAWADRTHFMFPGFENSSASNPRGLTGAESLLEEAFANQMQ